MPRVASPLRAALAAAVLCAAAAVLLALLPVEGSPPDFGNRTVGDSRTAEVTPPAPAPSARAGSPAEPLSVSVPRIDMTARVKAVGVLKNGKVRIPEAPGAAGWYRYGAAPGQGRGSAVLVGHVDYATGELGAFAALYEVRAGDAVSVSRARGAPVRYEVTARQVIDQDRLPAELFRRHGPPVLTLITCAPPYDEESGYRNNMVVIAEPVSS